MIVHGPRSVGIGKEWEPAVFYLLNEDSPVKLLLHQHGQFVDSPLVGIAGQQTRALELDDIVRFGKLIRDA